MTHFRSPPDCLELVFLADEETDVDTTAGLRDVARITGRQVQRKKTWLQRINSTRYSQDTNEITLIPSDFALIFKGNA